MGTSILKRASGFLRGKGKYAVALAGVLAVTAAGYRMALPGFTLERELVCGLEEHVHTEACFPPPDTGTDGKPDDIGASGSPGADSQPGEDGAAGGADQTEKVLACPFEGKEAHTHDAACYQTERKLACGQEEEAGGHTHGDSCYTTMQELTCGQEEAAGHTHDVACYQTGTNLTCGHGEGDGGHSHGEGCYDENGAVICGQEEGAGGHSHSDACYSAEDKLVCGQEESGGHTHGDDCYTETKELTCGQEEAGGGERHTHTDACYQEENTLICGKEEYDPGNHVHGDECYIEQPVAGNSAPGTGSGEAGSGTAGDNGQGTGDEAAGGSIEGTGNSTAGEEDGEQRQQPICGLEEHTHSEACYGEEIMAIADNIVAQGEWWQLDDEGLLTITATETVTEIPDYKTDYNGISEVPWRDVADEIISVRIEGMTRIGSGAFARHEKLMEVSISDGVTAIGYEAFLYCSSLRSIDLPDSLETIDGRAFANAGLTQISIPDNVNSIGGSVFSNSQVRSIKLPERLETIGDNMLSGCQQLINITIPNNVKKIGRYAFQNCKKLAYIEIPDSVTEIGVYAFEGCENLAEIKLPEGLKAISTGTFWKCSRLSGINIPEGVTTIESGAFEECRSLAGIILPKSMAKIGGRAFWNCKALAEIELPEGLNEIGAGSFGGCDSLSALAIKAKELKVSGSDTFLTNLRHLKVYCDSVDILGETLLSRFQYLDVSFAGPGYFTMEAPIALGSPARKGLAGGRYYADENGVLYLLQEGKASLAHVPAGIKEYRVKNHIPPAEEGQEGWTVAAVERDALKMADDLESLWFENPADIERLPDYSCANCPSLTSVNGKTSVVEVHDLFIKANDKVEFGSLAFYHTGLEGGNRPETDNGEITIEVGGNQVLSMSTKKTGGEAGGSLEFYTGENALTTVGLSGPRNETEYTAARVYFSFEDGDGVTRYGDSGGKDNYEFKLKSSEGVEYTIKACKAEAPSTYYYEIPLPAAGDTLKLEDIPSWYPSPASAGGSARIWPVLLTDAERDAVGNGVTGEGGRYHQAAWKTKADSFPVEKQADANPTVKGGSGGDGNLYINSLSYSIAMNREGDTQTNIGKDYMRSVDFEDTLTLPAGVEWRQELLEAVEAGSSYWVSTTKYSNYIEEYYANAGNTSCLLFRIESENPVIHREPIVVEEDGKKILKIRWRTANSSTEAEIPALEMKLSLGDEAILVDLANAPGSMAEGEGWCIVNRVEAVQHFTHSEDAVREALAEAYVQVSEGKCEIRKTSDAKGNMIWGDSYGYEISLENTGSFPYKGIGSIQDTLSKWLYIKPADMEKMVREAESTDDVDRLEITVSYAALCKTAPEDGNGYYPGKEVTGTDGKTYTLTQQDTGVGTEYRGLKSEDPAQKAWVTLSILWERGKEGMLLSYMDGEARIEKEIKGRGSLGRELESIGCAVVSHTSYTVSWGMEENYELKSGSGPKFRIPVTVKDSFMLLAQDVLNQNGKSSISLEKNTAVTMTAEGVKDKEGTYSHIDDGSSVVYRDYTLNKNVGKNGGGMDTKKDTVIAGDILNYSLSVDHQKSSGRGIVPLVDRMSGAQVLLVPVKGNSILEGFGLETKEVDGEEYYLLNEERVYRGVTLGGCLTDSITVTKGEGGELDTMVRWYLADIRETGIKRLEYNAYVMPSQGGEDGTFYLSNESWLNDHQSHRLYAPVGVTGTNAVIEKKIVLSQGGSRNPVEDEVTAYSPIHEGGAATYRLLIRNMGLGRVIKGSQIYDILPETWGFQWSKENVKIEYYDAGDGSYKDTGSYEAGDGSGKRAYKLTKAEDWEIESVTVAGKQKQHIAWGEEFRLELEGDIYIYVTLEWPEGEAWEEYAKQYGTKRLENNFYCYKLYDRVTHDLAAGTKAYLQKGVYYSGNSRKLETDEENRFYYANKDSDGKHPVVYYTCIYNGGNTRLYLSELQDRVPEGFTVQRNSFLSTNASAITDAGGNGVAFQQKWVSGSIKDLGDGRISISLKGYEGGNYIQYDEQHGKWYLAPGEAVCFTYVCEPGEYADTDDLATNAIAMPYYDAAGELEVADVSVEGPVYDENEIAWKNDGSCLIMTAEEAEKEGFAGGKPDTQWLASEVAVRRGGIAPGITKKAASITSGGQTKPAAGSAHVGDTINWEVTVANSGREPIIDYTLSDAMEMPYGFTGPVAYKMESWSWYRNRYETIYTDELFKVNDCTEKAGRITLNLSVIATSVNKLGMYLDGKRVYSPVTLQEGSVLSVSKQTAASGGKVLEYDISISQGSGEEIELMIRCKSGDMAIPSGGRGILTLSTKNITNKHWNKAYFNHSYITPEMQQYDGELVSQGNQTVHNGKPSVQSSARIQVSYGYTTSSAKKVEEVENTDNKASSNDEKNYILLQDAGKKFRYTLTVDNTKTDGMANGIPMEKLVLIDSLPQKGDHNPFTQAEPRFSAFRVDLAEDPRFEVWIKGPGESEGTARRLDANEYRLEYSDKTEFEPEDWKGEDTGDWKMSMSDVDPDRSKVRSFRIIIKDESTEEDLIPAGASVEVKFIGQIAPEDSDEPPMPGETAWNGFGYRYRLKGATDELESTPLNVGVRLPDVPRLVKKLENEEGKPAPAQEDTAFRFLIYQGSRLPLKKGFTQEELAKALLENKREFTCVEAVVKAGSTQSDTVILKDLKKWGYQSGAETAEGTDPTETSGGWMPTEETWVWMENENYTVVELPLGEEDIYRLDSLGGLRDNGYTFTHSGVQRKKIIAVNSRKSSTSYELPETGGAGTSRYTLSGLLCLAAAGLLFGRKRQGAGPYR